MKPGIFFLAVFLTLAFCEEKKSEFQQAVAWYSQKKFTVARDLFIKVLAADDFNAQACFYLGTIYLIEGRQTEAGQYLKKAVELDSANPEYWHNYGLLQYKLKLYDVAVEMFKRALAVHPGHMASVYHTAWAYFRLHQFEKAADAFQVFINTFPDYPDNPVIKILIEKIRTGLAAGSLVSGTVSPGSEDIISEFDKNKLKEKSKIIESKAGEAIDQIKMEIQIIE